MVRSRLRLRYHSVFTIVFSAASDVEANDIAVRHHEQLRDDLLIEGADHPSEITLNHVYAAGERDTLSRELRKAIPS